MDNYLEIITRLLEKVDPNIIKKYKIKFKNVFGAIGVYVDSRIFISCGKFGVALKLPSKTLENLLNKKEAKHLKYFVNGHIKKEYAVLSKQIIEDTRQLRKLVDESIQYVLK